MNINLFISISLAYVAGTYGQYFKWLADSPLENPPPICTNPLVRVGLWLVTTCGSLIAAAYVYELIVTPTGSIVAGGLAAAGALYLRYFMSARRALKMYMEVVASKALKENTQ